MDTTISTEQLEQNYNIFNLTKGKIQTKKNKKGTKGTIPTIVRDILEKQSDGMVAIYGIALTNDQIVELFYDKNYFENHKDEYNSDIDEDDVEDEFVDNFQFIKHLKFQENIIETPINYEYTNTEDIQYRHIIGVPIGGSDNTRSTACMNVDLTIDEIIKNNFDNFVENNPKLNGLKKSIYIYYSKNL